MKKVIKGFVGVALLAATVSACSYGGVAVSSTDKAVVMRNDGLLMGALRKAYVCDVTATGLSNCATDMNP